MNIHMPGKTTTGSTRCSIKNPNGVTSLDNATLVGRPTECSVSHVTKAKFNNTVVSKQATRSSESGNRLAYVPSKGLSGGQTLEDNVDILAVPEDGSIIDDHDNIPRKLQDCCVARVERNMHCDSVQSRTEALTSMNPLPLQERRWDSTDRDCISRNLFASKENTCPNGGNNAVDLSTPSEQKQSVMLSPIPLSSRIAGGFGPQSENQMRKKDPNGIPFVNDCRSTECRAKRAFLTHPSVSVQNLLGSEGLNVSLDKHFQDYAKLLDYVKEQERRINLLEKKAEERNSRFEELVEKNSKLNARVMVLETAVALMQEKLES